MICGAPVVAVLRDDLGQLLADDLPLPGGVGQDVLEVGDLELELGELVDDLLALERREPAQLHVEDRVGLELVDARAARSGPRGRRRPSGDAADQRDDLVERVERLDAGRAGCARAPRPCAAGTRCAGRMTSIWCVDPVADEPVERQRARHAVDERQHVRAEVGLQLGVLVAGC